VFFGTFSTFEKNAFFGKMVWRKNEKKSPLTNRKKVKSHVNKGILGAKKPFFGLFQNIDKNR